MTNLTIMNESKFKKILGHSLFARFHPTFQPQLVPMKKTCIIVYKFHNKNTSTIKYFVISVRHLP